jgi:hypothetical protein
MKKLLLFLSIFILATSCSKPKPVYNTGNGQPILWPLRAGGEWIYQDSVFADSGLQSSNLDTALITIQTETDQYGTIYYGISEPSGWFGTGGFVAVDASNTTIYEVDSANNSPYLFFQAVEQDGQFIGSGYDYSDASCTKQASQYGYVTPTIINGFSCLKNIEYTVDCNNVTKEEVVTYVSPGVGVVRMEDYMADSIRNNALFMDYSQTLQSHN